MCVYKIGVDNVDFSHFSASLDKFNRTGVQTHSLSSSLDYTAILIVYEDSLTIKISNHCPWSVVICSILRLNKFYDLISLTSYLSYVVSPSLHYLLSCMILSFSSLSASCSHTILFSSYLLCIQLLIILSSDFFFYSSV